jgi:hypothetical protein
MQYTLFSMLLSRLKIFSDNNRYPLNMDSLLQRPYCSIKLSAAGKQLIFLTLIPRSFHVMKVTTGYQVIELLATFIVLSVFPSIFARQLSDTRSRGNEELLYASLYMRSML